VEAEHTQLQILARKIVELAKTLALLIRLVMMETREMVMVAIDIAVLRLVGLAPLAIKLLSLYVLKYVEMG
jgi:hypothetical protein